MTVEKSGVRFDERTVGRLISAAESGRWSGAGENYLSAESYVVGVTGPPGSGKSTLIDALLAAIRACQLRVAVLAVDPSSDRTGGAVLGDRVRMSSHSKDNGVFIRSMGTRGSTRGLADATRDAIRILNQAGYDVIIIETVGVGQIELEIMSVADVVAAVVIPGLGDAMQMNKAGLMEVADLFVVNMADRPETEKCVMELKHSLAFGGQRELPKICKTVATEKIGVDELWSELHNYWIKGRLDGTIADRRRDHLVSEFRNIAVRNAVRCIEEAVQSERFADLISNVRECKLHPSEASRRLLANLLK